MDDERQGVFLKDEDGQEHRAKLYKTVRLNKIELAISDLEPGEYLLLVRRKKEGQIRTGVYRDVAVLT